MGLFNTAVKYVVFVVDGTAALEPYWRNIFSHYLENTIRCISREAEKDPGVMLFFGLVNCKAGLDISDYLHPRTWITDVNIFIQQLSTLDFRGGSCDAAIAHGLHGALTLYPKPPIGAPESLVAYMAAAKKHCVLVAASNPSDLPKQLWLPIVRDGRFPDLRTESRSVFADDVARVFAESSVSLSVISPKHLPRLEHIYNAGNGITEEVASSANNIVGYNPHNYLVLLSEKFPEIHSAFKEQQMMMIRSPSPTSVEGQANFMETESPSGNHQLTDEDAMIYQNMMDQDLPIEKEDYIHPRETFTIMPGITPRVPNVPSNDFSRPITVTGPTTTMAFPSDEVEMTYEVILSDTRRRVMLEAGFWDSSNRTAAQAVLRDVEENTKSAPFWPIEIPPSPQAFNNFQPQEFGTLPSMSQTGGQIMTNSIVVSSDYSDTNSNFSTSPPVGLQYGSGQVGSESAVLSSGVRPGEIEGFPSTVLQPVSPSFFRSQAPGSVPQYATPGLVGNFTATEAETFDLFGNLSDLNTIVSSAPSFDGNFSFLQSEITGLDESFWAEQAVASYLVGDLSDPHATVSSTPFLAYDTQAVAFEDPGTVGGLGAPQAAHFSSPGGNLVVPQTPSSGSTDHVPHPSSINGKLQPTQAVFDNNRGRIVSNTEGVGDQSTPISSLASVIESALLVHGGVGGVGAANLNNGRDGYVLAWQGIIYVVHHGKFFSLGEAKVYRKSDAPASLTSDWAKRIPINQVLRQKSFDKLPYTGTADIVIFETRANHKLYQEMKNNDYCIRMDLPSQTMLFFPTISSHRYFGAVFHRPIPPFRSVGSFHQQGSQQVPEQEQDTDNTAAKRKDN